VWNLREGFFVRLFSHHDVVVGEANGGKEAKVVKVLVSRATESDEPHDERQMLELSLPVVADPSHVKKHPPVPSFSMGCPENFEGGVGQHSIMLPKLFLQSFAEGGRSTQQREGHEKGSSLGHCKSKKKNSANMTPMRQTCLCVILIRAS